MAKKHVAVSLRKPPSPEKLDAFVAGSAEAQPVSPSPKRRRRAAIAPSVVAQSVAVATPEAAAVVRAEVVTSATPETEVVAVSETTAVAASETTAVAAAGAVVAVETAAVVAVETAAVVAVETAAVEMPAVLRAEVGATDEVATHETPEKGAAAPAAARASDVAAVAEVAAAAPAPKVTSGERVASPGATVGVMGPGMTPFTVVLPQALAERLAMHCIAQGYEVNQVIGEALDQHLSRRLGTGSWSAGDAGGEGPTAGRRGAGAFRWEEPRRWADAFRGEESRRWADAFRQGSRVEQVIQVGRALYGLWQKRPWAA